jgi:hypothetical protein
MNCCSQPRRNHFSAAPPAIQVKATIDRQRHHHPQFLFITISAALGNFVGFRDSQNFQFTELAAFGSFAGF